MLVEALLGAWAIRSGTAVPAYRDVFFRSGGRETVPMWNTCGAVVPFLQQGPVWVMETSRV